MRNGTYRVKTLTREQGEQVNIHQFPNFSATGSVMGMKNLYYGLDSKLVRCGGWIYNVTSEQRIYDELAY